MSELEKPSLYVSRARHLSACLFHDCKRRDHSGRYRLRAAFVPTKSLQHLCFIGRAWANFPSFYSTFRKNPNNNKVPQVYALCLLWLRSHTWGLRCKALNYLDFFPRRYIVLLGFRVLLELLNQVISPCPKMCQSLRYEYEYQHRFQNPNTVLLV